MYCTKEIPSFDHSFPINGVSSRNTPIAVKSEWRFFFFSFNKVLECYIRTTIALKEHIICKAVKLINRVDLRNDYKKRAMTVVNTVNGVHRIKINFCIKGNPVY